jgi:hypothetical protein
VGDLMDLVVVEQEGDAHIIITPPLRQTLSAQTFNRLFRRHFCRRCGFAGTAT